MTKIFSLALFTVFLISGCVSTQTKQIPLRDDIILEANDAALCSLSYTRPDSRIDKEIISRKLDCDPISLRCSAKGFKQGTKKFLQCKKDIKNELTLEEKKTKNSGKEKQKISQQTELTNKNKYTITDKQEPSCSFVQEFFGGRDCRKEEIQRAMDACESRKKWVDKMQCKQSVPISDPLDAEINAYLSVLIEQMKNHQITEAQAEYAFQRKVSEVAQHIDKANAEQKRLNLIERQQDALAHQQKMERMNETIEQNNDRMMEAMKNDQPTTRTECRPILFGRGFDCTTY